MLDERNSNISELMSENDLVSQFNTNRDQFADMQKFPERLSLNSKEPGREVMGDSVSGRFVKVKAGGKDYVVPNPYIILDDNSVVDTGIGSLYECKGFTINKDQHYNNYTLLSPAEIDESLKLTKKGSLQVKS